MIYNKYSALRVVDVFSPDHSSATPQSKRQIQNGVNQQPYHRAARKRLRRWVRLVRRISLFGIGSHVRCGAVFPTSQASLQNCQNEIENLLCVSKVFEQVIGIIRFKFA